MPTTRINDEVHLNIDYTNLFVEVRNERHEFDTLDELQEFLDTLWDQEGIQEIK